MDPRKWLQASCATLPAQRHSPELERTKKLHGLLSPPHATRKPAEAHAPLILTLMQKKHVRKPLRRNRGGRPRRAAVRLRRSGRASGSALRSAPMAGIAVPVSAPVIGSGFHELGNHRRARGIG